MVLECVGKINTLANFPVQLCIEQRILISMEKVKFSEKEEVSFKNKIHRSSKLMFGNRVELLFTEI